MRAAFPDLKFECHAVARDHIHWQPEINPHPAKALDIHHFSPAIRDLMFADAISEFLGLIFESKAFASQTLGFLRGSAQEGHQDSAYVAYTIPRQFAATWTALEDVTIGAGELFYYPGSHRFEDFVYNEHFKSVHEAQRMTGEQAMRGQVERHVSRWRGVRNNAAFRKRRSPPRRATCWYGTPTWCTAAIRCRAITTRKSIVTHYCPKHLSPLFSENTAYQAVGPQRSPLHHEPLQRRAARLNRRGCAAAARHRIRLGHEDGKVRATRAASGEAVDGLDVAAPSPGIAPTSAAQRARREFC